MAEFRRTPTPLWLSIDYNISDKTTLTGRYALYSEDQFSGSWTYSPYAGLLHRADLFTTRTSTLT